LGAYKNVLVKIGDLWVLKAFIIIDMTETDDT